MIGWCMGAIVTVMVGAEGFKELEEQEDPLLQAILREGPLYPVAPRIGS